MLKLADQKKLPDWQKRQKAKEKDPFAREGGSPASNTALGQTIGQNRRILVADDNPVVLKAFELKLKALGFDVSTTSTGESVAGAAHKCRAELLILDIHFSSSGSTDWTGFSVIQWLRRFPDLAAIPIILITGAESAEYKAKALEAGTVALFEKPVDFQQLVATILAVFGAPPPVGSGGLPSVNAPIGTPPRPLP